MLMESLVRPGLHLAEDEAGGGSPPAGQQPPEWATLGANAPTAWPTGSASKVPVTGELSPHAKAALERMDGEQQAEQQDS